MKLPINFSEIFSGIIGEIIKYLFLLLIGGGSFVYLKSVLLQKVSTPLYVLVILGIILLSFLILFIRDFSKRPRYFIPIKGAFDNGSEPNIYSRRTKWTYKSNPEFYFIPLLSHSYHDVDFLDLCGPYCSGCDHLCHLDRHDNLGEYGKKFFCINCKRKYKIPKELLGNYWNKLFGYFQGEYKQGRLKESE